MKKIPILIFLVGVCFLFYYKVDREPLSPPNIESIIRTSVLALQKQNEMTVITARLNSVATSSYTYSGMLAQQTDIQTTEVRYVVDLSKIDSKDVEVHGNEILVKVPDIKIIQPAWSYNPVTYTNNSWLFNVGDATRILADKNKNLIMKDLDKQAKVFIPNARSAAQQTIASLMQIPLDATSSKFYVKIVMNQ